MVEKALQGLCTKVMTAMQRGMSRSGTTYYLEIYIDKDLCTVIYVVHKSLHQCINLAELFLLSYSGIIIFSWVE